MKTKIIATIGPATWKKVVLQNLIASGTDILRLNTKYLTEKDCDKITQATKNAKEHKIMIDIKCLEVIKWVRKRKFDYLAVSFAESATQLQKIRKMFDRKIKIIAKIESKKGIKNINQIIKVSEGIMIARGDLGKNIPFEKVPIVQKILLKKCKKKNKIDITATEMLLSMVKSKIPTRAEVSDVANAVLDGSDAVMLSEETAIGKYPCLTVKTMRKIVYEAEKYEKLLKN